MPGKRREPLRTRNRASPKTTGHVTAKRTIAWLERGRGGGNRRERIACPAVPCAERQTASILLYSPPKVYTIPLPSTTYLGAQVLVAVTQDAGREVDARERQAHSARSGHEHVAAQLEHALAGRGPHQEEDRQPDQADLRICGRRIRVVRWTYAECLSIPYVQSTSE